MHFNIECFYNGVPVTEKDQQTAEWNYFQQFHQHRVVGKLIPYRTEWMIWDDELKIAGSIDML